MSDTLNAVVITGDIVKAQGPKEVKGRGYVTTLRIFNMNNSSPNYVNAELWETELKQKYSVGDRVCVRGDLYSRAWVKGNVKNERVILLCKDVFKKDAFTYSNTVVLSGKIVKDIAYYNTKQGVPYAVVRLMVVRKKRNHFFNLELWGGAFKKIKDLGLTKKSLIRIEGYLKYRIKSKGDGQQESISICVKNLKRL